MPKKTKVSPRKKPAQARSQSLVDSIVTAATRIFQQGYDKTTTNKIAEVAGVSIGSLYQYFPNKDALIAKMVDERINQQLSDLQARVEKFKNEDLEKILLDLITMIAKPAFENRELLHVLYERGPSLGMTKAVVETRKKASEIIKKLLIQKGPSFLKQQNVGLLVFLIVNGVLGMISAAVVAPPEDVSDEDIIKQIHEFVKQSLKTGKAKTKRMRT